MKPMAPTAPVPSPDPFTALRPRLFGIAYRMLGTRADAEDVLQDAWLRWSKTDPAELQSAEAWLVTVVSRLSIDRLRAAKTEREAYVGMWLPEPMVEDIDHNTPESAAELAGEVSVALMWVLERLAPEERAAFLLFSSRLHGASANTSPIASR
jgi:RNA polymerase sigma-70 factor, ECF subfamily